MASVTRLRLRVMASGMSAADFARAVVVHPSLVSKYMAGEREIPRRWAETFSHHLHCAPSDVCGWVEMSRVLDAVSGSS